MMQKKPAPEPGLARKALNAVTRLTDSFSYPLSLSHYVELVNPLWATHAMQARVEKVWDETKNARTLTLKPGLNWRGFRAGQHVRVGIPVDGKHFTRTYTISSPPEREDGRFTITVKAIEGGTISHHLVRSIRVGDYLPIGLPQGDFHLPDAQPVSPLFITAGSGATPAMSMVRSMIAQERLVDTVHIHYAPHEFDVIFGKDFHQLAQEHTRYVYHPVYTHPFGKSIPSEGHFSAGQLDRLCPDWRDREVYACGPQSLLVALELHFGNAGRARHLHIERFRAAFAEIPAQATGGRVWFAKAGVQADADATTNLLRVAEQAGMNPPHGCRMGICHACDTRLVSGCVRDLRTGKVHSEAGSVIQPCVCATAGDCELDL
ncbi:ferredoxin reductase [Polaromonas sp.]|uniref:ferredoxin reductase n=1 Tax=Polaromonas sp. TaxID=1869339 RepID=UPI00272F87D7|nr:ferredoxin reductase [Polaromonas sp.]MDP1740917.1 ferredoxin reductase [Polaromonas sp.]